MTSVDGGTSPAGRAKDASMPLEADLLAAIDLLYQTASDPTAWPEAIAVMATSSSDYGPPCRRG